MNASKSLNLLSIAHNYQELGRNVVILTPSIDDRYGVGKVTSRAGLSKEALIITPQTSILDLILSLDSNKKIDCVLVDELHFYTVTQVEQLAELADEYDITVMCFGLLVNFKGELFIASKRLIELADKLEEIKTLCCDCDNKATMILKYKDGVPVFDGEEIEVGGNDTYKSVCRKCWMKERRS